MTTVIHRFTGTLCTIKRLFIVLKRSMPGAEYTNLFRLIDSLATIAPRASPQMDSGFVSRLVLINPEHIYHIIFCALGATPLYGAHHRLKPTRASNVNK